MNANVDKWIGDSAADGERADLLRLDGISEALREFVGDAHPGGPSMAEVEWVLSCARAHLTGQCCRPESRLAPPRGAGRQKVVHLRSPRGGAACGAVHAVLSESGGLESDISLVTCPMCLRVHEAKKSPGYGVGFD